MPAVERVGAVAAYETVVAVAAEEGVGAGTALEVVESAAGVYEVVAVGAVEALLAAIRDLRSACRRLLRPRLRCGESPRTG